MSKIRFLGVVILVASVLSMMGLVSGVGQDQPRYGGTLIFALNYSAPVALDPIRIPLDKSYDMGVILAIDRGLVLLDTSSLKVAPAIAKSWNISADGLVYTFHLRKGAKFQNGREVTAQDFGYSFERLMNPKEAAIPTYILKDVAGVDEYKSGISLSYCAYCIGEGSCASISSASNDALLVPASVIHLNSILFK